MNNIKFDWNSEKAASNFRKHGIRFDTALQVFDDEDAIHIADRVVDGEQRWHIIGTVDGFTVLLVVYLSEEVESGFEYVRIISARRAERKERLIYEQSFSQARR